MNKKSLPLLLGSALVLAAALSGCVVVPAEPVAVAPPGVTYIAPVGIAPGIGYSWRYYPRRGWGWWHPQRGWHGGWHH